jgi:hypothetical protein
MNFQFIEVSPAAVLLDRTKLESENDGYVYKHLKHYVSHSKQIPAFAAKAVDGKLMSVGRHKYLSIAQELGYQRIRAVLQDEAFEELKAQGVPGLLSVVPNEELENEDRSLIATGWHVFFFKSGPSPKVAAEIEARFRNFLNESLPAILGNKAEIVIESHFDFSGPCLEMRFPTPRKDRVWFRSFLALALSVSSEVCLIDTYQGRQFRFAS